MLKYINIRYSVFSVSLRGFLGAQECGTERSKKRIIRSKLEKEHENELKHGDRTKQLPVAKQCNTRLRTALSSTLSLSLSSISPCYCYSASPRTIPCNIMRCNSVSWSSAHVFHARHDNRTLGLCHRLWFLATTLNHQKPAISASQCNQHAIGQ